MRMKVGAKVAKFSEFRYLCKIRLRTLGLSGAVRSCLCDTINDSV